VHSPPLLRSEIAETSAGFPTAANFDDLLTQQGSNGAWLTADKIRDYRDSIGIR